jgi:DNA mismatch repair ATPase MutS
VKLLSIPERPLSAGVLRRPTRRVDPDELQIDRQTFRDLEIFAADRAPGLFDVLDRTHTNGGGRALRARWRRPWSNPERIRRVQQSIQHIIEHRFGFDLIPGEVVLSSVERHLHSGMPVVNARNPIELFLQGLEIRFGDIKQYWKIVNGVDRTIRLLRALQRLAARPELHAAPGDLGPYLDELRTLVNRPAFQNIPSEGEGELSVWKLLRIDRVLREDERAAIDRLLQLTFEIDALVSMADATREFGYVMPEAIDGPLAVQAEGVYHPFLKNPVPNALQADQQKRLLFLTGPNMAGKTTYLRACGTALYLAHLGMGVPARSFRFAPCGSLFSAIALADSVREGVSFFRAEALRVKSIARALANGRRVIALLDEPFMGTNVKDALDASRVVLSRLAAKSGSIFLVSSHLIELGETLLATGFVDCYRFEAAEQGGRLEFDYLLRPGLSAQRLGVRVLEEEGVFALLDQDPPHTTR